MKTITTVHLSEYKKLSQFEKNMIKFFKNKIWLMGLIPIYFFFIFAYSFSQHNFWYLGLSFLTFCIIMLSLVEKYGKLSTDTDYCTSCKSELKYLGKEAYTD